MSIPLVKNIFAMFLMAAVGFALVKSDPIVLFSIGMALAKVDMNKVLFLKRLPLATALRMIVFPLVLLAIFKLTPLAAPSPNGTTVLTIVLMGAAAPTACVIGLIAHLCGKDFFYSSAISVATVLISIISIPFLVFLYQL